MAKRKGKPQGIVVRSAPPAAAALEATATAASQDAGAGATGRRKKKRRKSGVAVASAAADEAVDGGDAESDDCDDASAALTAPAAPAAAAGGVVSPTAGLSLPALDFKSIGRRANAEDIMSWLLWPMSPAVFFAEYWEKKPLHLKRQQPGFYGDLFSKAELDKYLRTDQGLSFGKLINLVRFDSANGRKVALSPLRPPPESAEPCQRAEPKEVDAAWADGASIQAMHPQQYHEAAWRLLSALEGAFGALFGANAYLTPSGAQGLAPHFDDVEVFMLQLEGQKRWRLHAPPAGEEYPLPRDYSRDFTADELGEQLLDCVVQPGDLLYLPRGTVHTGVSTKEGFSHHLTVSTYQKMSWFQVMEKSLMGALEKAASSSPDFRTGVPMNYLRFMGTWNDTADANAESEAGKQRGAFLRRFKNLLRSLEEFADLDDVCDELGVDFSAQRLPPPPVAPGAATSASSSDAAAPSTDEAAPAITLDSHVRWVEPSAVRLVLSTDPETSEATAVVFHSCANDRDLHMCKNTDEDEDIGCLRFEAALFMPALRALHSAGSSSVRCGDLPLDDEDDRTALCENLLEAGVLELAPGQHAAAPVAVRSMQNPSHAIHPKFG